MVKNRISLLPLISIFIFMSFSLGNIIKTSESNNNFDITEDSIKESIVQHYIDSLTPSINTYNEFTFNCQLYNQNLNELKSTFLANYEKYKSDSISFQALINTELLQKLKNKKKDSLSLNKNMLDYFGLSSSSNKKDSTDNKTKNILNSIIHQFAKDSTVFRKVDSINLISKVEKVKGEYKKLLTQKEAQQKLAAEIKKLSDQCFVCTNQKDSVELIYKNSVYGIIDSLISNQKNNIFKYQYKGKKYLCFTLQGNNNQYNVSIVNNKSKLPRTIKMVWDDLSLKKMNPVFVMNAGMFKEDYSAQGLLVENGKKISNVDKDTSANKTGNFYLYPNGIFYIDAKGNFHVKTTREFLIENNSLEKADTLKNKKIMFATQSGPMMVVKNKIHNVFNPNSKNVNIRNGVGVRNNGNKTQVYFVVSEDQVTFFDFASFYRDVLHCQNALYLDGVVSRTYMSIDKTQLGKLDNTMGLGPVITICKEKQK